MSYSVIVTTSATTPRIGRMLPAATEAIDAAMQEHWIFGGFAVKALIGGSTAGSAIATVSHPDGSSFYLGSDGCGWVRKAATVAELNEMLERELDGCEPAWLR